MMGIWNFKAIYQCLFLNHNFKGLWDQDKNNCGQRSTLFGTLRYKEEFRTKACIFYQGTGQGIQ